MHPLQTTLPQHAMYLNPVFSDGNRIKQIGQSSAGGGCLNNSSSCNSAACSAASLTCSSHSFLCLCLCFFLHAALQYLTCLHLLHVLFISLPSLPQFAHIDTILSSSVELMLMLFNISLTSLKPSLQILSDIAKRLAA